jgi:hypothetical protein
MPIQKRTTRQDWQEWAQMNANRPRLSREEYRRREKDIFESDALCCGCYLFQDDCLPVRSEWCDHCLGGEKPDFRRLQIRVWVKKSEAKAYRDYMQGF